MTRRKVRKDFDITQPITVDVLNSSVEEKKKVQQAFFDIGIKWVFGGETYGLLKESFYTNVTSDDDVTSSLMWVDRENLSSIVDPITPKEFFDMVYEEESQGHPHAELMMAYAEDAKTHTEPWKLWEVSGVKGHWDVLLTKPKWDFDMEYRRKPKTHLVNDVEVPDLRIKPKINDRYYVVDICKRDYFSVYVSNDDNLDYLWAERGLCYEHTEAGKQSAILHAKIMLGIVDK